MFYILFNEYKEYTTINIYRVIYSNVAAKHVIKPRTTVQSAL